MKSIYRCLGLAALLVSISASTAAGATASGFGTQRLALDTRGGPLVRSDTGGVGVDAGADRRVVVGEPTLLNGRVKSATRGERVRVHWRLTSAPHPFGAQRMASTQTVLSHQDQAAARFRADAPGRYTLRLVAGSGSTARSDTVTLSVVPPTPLVSVETMARRSDVPGIQVGATTYPAPGILGAKALVQVLVLDRQTLGFVSNSSYDDTDAVEAALHKLDASTLVIAVLQRPVGQGMNPLRGEGLAQALAPMGFPKLAAVPRSGGSVSAIGVPGTSPGDANVNINADGQDGGDMRGYLTPDQYLEYGFIASGQVPFSFPELPQGCAPDSHGCEDVGFRVTDIDSRTGDPRDQRFFGTDSRSMSAADQTVQALSMSDFLNRIPAGDLVRIETESNRGSPVEARFRPPVGLISPTAMKLLAAAVAGVGGTRNGFNAEALASGPADGGPVYSLIGWAGAGEGNGAEAALQVDGTGNTPDLSGVLRRDRQYELRPVQVNTAGPVSNALQKLVLQPPTDAWPDSGPALNYLGATDERLGCAPRSAYWSGSLTEPDLNAIAAKIRVTAYPNTGASDLCTGTPVQFTDVQFQAAKTELLEELGWVGNVRSYLDKLASPFADGALENWVQAQTIADQIYQAAKQPDDKTSLRWAQFTSTMIKLIGAASFNPIAGGVAGIMANLLDLGVWVAGTRKDGTPGGDDVRFQADELGAHLVDQAQQAQATYARIGDIIVSDYDKLKVVGADGGCNPSSPDCPKAYSYTEADKATFSAAFYRAIQRIAYEKLLPLGYRVYQLENFDSLAPSDRGRPPDVPAWYHCAAYHPFYGFSPRAYTSLLEELDPVSHINLYDVFVLSAPVLWPHVYGISPPEELLKRMFDPVATTDDPTAGGLGISPAELMRTAKHTSFSEAQAPNGFVCSFG